MPKFLVEHTTFSAIKNIFMFYILNYMLKSFSDLKSENFLDIDQIPV